MSQVQINNGDSGLTVRTNLNNMFTEIYSSLYSPIKQKGITANFNQAIAANTFISQLSLFVVSGTPTVRVGITPNGTEILPDTALSGSQLITVQDYFASAGTVYITFTSGTGNINARFDVMTNFY